MSLTMSCPCCEIQFAVAAAQGSYPIPEHNTPGTPRLCPGTGKQPKEDGVAKTRLEGDKNCTVASALPPPSPAEQLLAKAKYTPAAPLPPGGRGEAAEHDAAEAARHESFIANKTMTVEDTQAIIDSPWIQPDAPKRRPRQLLPELQACHKAAKLLDGLTPAVQQAVIQFLVRTFSAAE